MKYLYYFANTSLVVRLLAYLAGRSSLPLASVTVIYLVDRWVVCIQLSAPLPMQRALNFESFLNENGYAYDLSASTARPVRNALRALDKGLSVTEVMHHHHVVVVSHGALQPTNLENFRTSFVKGLGYCPPSLV